MKSYYNEVYLQPKEKIYIKPDSPLSVGDICELSGEDQMVEDIKNIKIINGPYNKKVFVVTLLYVIKNIKDRYPEIKINILSERDILIEIEKPQNCNKVLLYLKLLLVSIIIFIGAGIAIMNFHADVNMDVVHSKFYESITGRKVENPLWVSIPYSLGIGIGMIVFFNHISPKDRKTHHPSPLDLELNSYQSTLDDYIRGKSKESKN